MFRGGGAEEMTMGARSDLAVGVYFEPARRELGFEFGKFFLGEPGWIGVLHIIGADK